MKSKIIAKIICAALILTSTLGVLSCGQSSDNSSSTTTTTAQVGGEDSTNAGDVSNDPAETAEDTTTAQKYAFTGQTFDGYTMRIITVDHDDWAWSTMMAEEENAEPINDAIYSRNRQIEAGLNVQLKEILEGDPSTKVKKAVKGGLDEYDVVFADSNKMGTMASTGHFLNLKEVSGLNLDAPYFSQGANKSFELFNKLYITTSDANVITNDAIWLLYFNKKILQDLSLENPYDLVRTSKWTADKYYEFAKAAAKDLDGDGVFTVNDQWGISSHDFETISTLGGMGETFIGINEEGVPYLKAPTERYIAAFAKAHAIANKENGVMLWAQGSYPGRNSDNDHAKKTFMNNMSLFCGEVLAHARVFREMTADFGILPHPKFDENQDQYYTYMIDTTPAFGIPVTVENAERSGVFMDAFTALSAETLVPAYYTISLQGKFSRDTESMEMLDIVRAGRVYDLAVIYDWGGYKGQVESYCFKGEGSNPVSIYDKYQGKVETAIQKTIDSFTANE